MPDHPPKPQDHFMRLFVASEPELLRYILAVIPNVVDAREVLQETASALWRKMDDYNPESPFTPWACRFASNEIRAFLRREQRHRRWLDEDLAEKLRLHQDQAARSPGASVEHLRECLEALPPAQRELLRRYYFEEHPIQTIAEALNRTADAVYKTLPPAFPGSPGGLCQAEGREDGLKELAARYLDGTATDAEVRELSARLRTDPAARGEYLRLASLHARLATDPALWLEKKAGPRLAPWRALIPALGAAAVLVLLAILFPGREKVPALPVATLLRTEEAIWAGESPAEGGRVRTGPLRLSAGRAMLRLDGGAELLLHGAVDLRLVDGGSVTLMSGEVHAKVPEAAVGFTIHTPGGKVVDLGTEFIASVNRDGETEVSVLKGEVEVPDAVGVVHRLTTGQSLALDRRGRTHQIAAHTTKETLQGWSQDGRDARLQAHEPFNYPEGDHDPAALGGGTGWSGPWTLLTGTGSKPPWSGTSSRMEVRRIEGRPAWVSPPGKNFRQRRIARPLDLSKDGVHYVSLAWFEEALAPEQRRPGFNPQRNLVIDLRGADETGPGRVGLRVDSLLRPVIESGAGQGFTSRVRVGENQRMLMIGKILSRRDGEDEVFLRVFNPDDPPGPFEPDPWDVCTRGLRLDAVLDRAILLSMGAKPRRIEEIRIGTTWHDVVAGWDAGLEQPP